MHCRYDGARPFSKAVPRLVVFSGQGGKLSEWLVHDVANKIIYQSRILLVGAGGIGCELLKNLVLTGFGEVHIVDLDTIDLSNLNRQFLFRQEHIKKSKALVGAHTLSLETTRSSFESGRKRERREIQSSY